MSAPKSLAMRTLDRKNSDAAARSALSNGWKVARRSYDYFVAIRGREQIAVWARGGAILSSRTEVSDDLDTTIGWMTEELVEELT